MLHDVVDTIRQLSDEVQHVPGECSGYCQHVDVEFNKPFESHTHYSLSLA